MMQPVIKWSGSKRSQAEFIAGNVPNSFKTYYEPFLGGGSVLYTISPRLSEGAVCGDICKPLIGCWNLIRDNPKRISDSYRLRWNRLQEEGSCVYYKIRDAFNDSESPEDFLFLSRTCFNGLIRFNKDGKFNSPFHRLIGVETHLLQRVGGNASVIIANPGTRCNSVLLWWTHLLHYMQNIHPTREHVFSNNI